MTSLAASGGLTLSLSGLDALIAIYFTFVMGIGFALRLVQTSTDFFLRALAAGLDHRHRVHLGESRGH